MVILGDSGGSDSIGWVAAVILGMLFVAAPQVAFIQYACRVAQMGFPRSHRRALAGTVFRGLMLLVYALRAYGAKEVRTDLGAIVFLTAAGGVWLILAGALFPWLDLSLRDDARERRNSVALVALLEALFAVQLTFIGGNIGEGPSCWNNAFCAALGTGGVLWLWLMLEVGGSVSASMLISRSGFIGQFPVAQFPVCSPAGVGASSRG